MSTTDDTRQRSIPELMGWEPAPNEWDYPPGTFQHPTRGFVVTAYGGYDVDDLLAWLTAAADKNVSTDTRRQSKWGGRQIVTLTVNRGAIDQQFEAPSILAALEQAVRAVAEACDE